MSFEPQKLLTVTGAIFIGIGLLLMILGRIPGIGKLPGDFYYRGDHVTIYFPIMTSICLSLLLSLIVYFLRR